MKANEILSSIEKESILDAISNAESKTSGEIKVHIQRVCNEDPVKHAGKIFQQLGMYKTENRNGILFYLAVKSKSFALVGDIGIHEKVGQSFWDEIRDEVIGFLKQGKIAEGLVAGIHKCGDQLKNHFPANKQNNPNEISNDISME